MELRCISGPSGSLNTPYGYFPSSKVHNWKRHTQQLSESQYWFLICRVRTIVGGKDKCKPLEVSLPGKVVYPKQYCIPEGSQRLVPSSRTRKMKVWQFPSDSYSTLVFGLWRQMDHWEWQWIVISLTMQWLQLKLLHKIRLHCLSKLTYTLVSGMHLLIWQMLFFSIFLDDDHQKQFANKVRILLHCPTSGVCQPSRSMS